MSELSEMADDLQRIAGSDLWSASTVEDATVSRVVAIAQLRLIQIAEKLDELSKQDL